MAIATQRWLAARSARLKAASAASTVQMPVSTSTPQVPRKQRWMFICPTASTAVASMQPPTSGSTAPPTMIRCTSWRRSSAAAISTELVATVSAYSDGRHCASARLVLLLSRNRNSPGSMMATAARASAALRSRRSSMRTAIGVAPGSGGSAPP